jgi:alanine racemase
MKGLCRRSSITSNSTRPEHSRHDRGYRVWGRAVPRPDGSKNVATIVTLTSMSTPLIDSARQTRHAHYRTWAEVSLPALRDNFGAVRRHVGAEVEVCAVVKADAYGHGAIYCARALEADGARWLGVTSTNEGLRLRDHAVRTRILVMTGFWHDDEEALVAEALTPAVWAPWQIDALQRAADQRRENVSVHLKINTGMNRLGADLGDFREMLLAFQRSPRVKLEGVFSHFASSEVLDAASVAAQAAEFDAMLRELHSRGLKPKYEHIANTAAVAARPHTWRNFVRPGIALYGYMLPLTREREAGGDSPHLQRDPGSTASLIGRSSAPAHRPNGSESDVDLLSNLRPVLSWKTRIIALRRIAPGTPVGYGARFVSKRDSVIAVVPVGYADGLSRQLSNRGRMIVRDQCVPIAGAVSMDVTTIDITDIPGVDVGDEVTILGATEHCTIDGWEHARLANTVVYETLTSIGKRVPRVYV